MAESPFVTHPVDAPQSQLASIVEADKRVGTAPTPYAPQCLFFLVKKIVRQQRIEVERLRAVGNQHRIDPRFSFVA